MIFGIKIKIVGKRKEVKAGTLVISNHVSYFDIFVLGSLFPTVFLSKIEVLKIPIIGWGAWAAGVLFVDRSSVHSGAKSIRGVAKALKKGATVVAFPEATTTNEEKIRNFKVGSFQAAVIGRIPIQNIAINYANFQDIGWAKGDFFPHFRRNVMKTRHNAYIVFGERFFAQGKNPREVLKLSQDDVIKSFVLAKKAKEKEVLTG